MMPIRSHLTNALRKNAINGFVRPAVSTTNFNMNMNNNNVRFQSTDPNAYATTDGYFEKSRLTKEEGNQRDFTYFLLGTNRFVMATAARAAAIKFVASMSASADVLALANAEFKIDGISPGQGITVKWRGKPIFIRRRTEEEIAKEAAVNLGELRDPETDQARSQNPEWMVIIGICTHLGCVPITNAGEYGGWFCPCHGSHYDVSGRIRKGPAPLNMEIPPYKFDGDDKVIIGVPP